MLEDTEYKQLHVERRGRGEGDDGKSTKEYVENREDCENTENTKVHQTNPLYTAYARNLF